MANIPRIFGRQNILGILDKIYDKYWTSDCQNLEMP